jgi:hypothetical protein
MMQNFESLNQDEKARIFQQHLQKGLDGMVEVMNQLPPDVKANIQDPSAMADTDEKRTMWYMGVNQAINRFNMANSAQAGDVAGVERMGLNDPKATQKDFTNAAENNAFDSFAKGFTPTKTVTKTMYPVGGLKGALADQESGGDYNSAPGPAYKKADGSLADMSKGEIALGKYQIVPKFWFDKIGLDPLSEEDRKKFMESPDLQDKAFDVVLQDSLSQFGGNMDKVIANYYGGPKAAAVVGTPDGDKPQSAGMPSVNEYVKSVKGKIKPGSDGDQPQLISEEKNKTQSDVALEILKQDPRLIDKIEPILKHLGKGSEDMDALKLLQRQAEEAGRNRRADQANTTRKKIFADKSDQSLYDDLTKAEVPSIASSLQDVDKVLAPAGGLKAASVVPGTDLWNRNVLPLLKSKAGVNMNSLLQRIYSLELKRISGVAVSDTEYERYKKVFATGGTNSPEEQMYALRAFVRSFRKQLTFAKAANKDSWERVAKEAGIDLDQIPDVPDAVGNAPESPKAPSADTTKADGLRKKYNY